MSLKINLKPHEKIVIGGAVITNGTTKSSFIVNNNDITILREKDVLTEDKANTPVKRIYFVIQCMYLRNDLNNSADYLKMFNSLLTDFLKACPSQYETCINILDYVSHGDFFKALKECNILLKHEEKVLPNVQSI